MVLAKVGVGRIAGDRRDLGGVLGEGALERRAEMLGRDLAERRHAERAGPFRCEQGIVAVGERAGVLWVICAI